MTLEQDRKWLTHMGHTTQKTSYSLWKNIHKLKSRMQNSTIILLYTLLSSKQTDYTCRKAVSHVLRVLMSHNATPTWQNKHKEGQSSAMTDKEQKTFECSKPQASLRLQSVPGQVTAAVTLHYHSWKEHSRNFLSGQVYSLFLATNRTVNPWITYSGSLIHSGRQRINFLQHLGAAS